MIYPYRCSDVLMIRYDLMFKLCFSYSETNNEEYEDDILANLCVFDFNVLQCYSSQINLKILCTLQLLRSLDLLLMCTLYI